MKIRGAIRGFTLPEVLVTIAIVATLAAVLLPALIGQISKGEASRTAEDLLAVQTGVSTFVSDVRKYPGKLGHLTDAVTASDSALVGGPYPPNLAAKWKGPYLSKQLDSNGDVQTAFGAEILSTFDDVVSVSTTYLTVSLAPISEADFNKVDEIIDETANSSTGLFRFTGTSVSGTATFYAMPVQ